MPVFRSSILVTFHSNDRYGADANLNHNIPSGIIKEVKKVVLDRKAGAGAPSDLITASLLRGFELLQNVELDWWFRLIDLWWDHRGEGLVHNQVLRDMGERRAFGMDRLKFKERVGVPGSVQIIGWINFVLCFPTRSSKVAMTSIFFTTRLHLFFQ